MSKPSIKVGVCGLGTVASGVISIFQRNGGLINTRCAVDVELSHIGARRDNPDCDTRGYLVSRDIFAVVEDPNIDIVVELIGGTTVARDLVAQALNNGKHVVTANKALIAEHGNSLLALAEEKGLSLRFEAAVAGGIPILKTLRESLAANQISSVAGIINGTGNYILTEMTNAGRDFNDVLAEAQALGYAEADPTFDIDGTDAAHKLVILASLAFGMPLNIDGPFCEGINQVAPEDLKFAAELGYRIKHLGIARRDGDRVDLRVHPTLIPQSKQIANVDGVLNTVMVKADAVGELVLVGPGAGSLPTASAVCGDLVDLARELGEGQRDETPALGVPVAQLVEPVLVPRGEVVSSWYLRMNAEDKPGVMSAITRTLGEQGISIESLIQRPATAGSRTAQVVILTDRAPCQCVEAAVASIETLAAVTGSIACLRVEDFEES
ncbi:MAG: hypothetical protein RLZZ602_307 [Pseudomonadota bacterium]